MRGKDYKDFKVVGDDYVDLYSLRVGDYFMEDTYPEVYQVTSIEGRTVLSKDITRNQEGVEWEYAASAYAPCLVQLAPKD